MLIVAVAVVVVVVVVVGLVVAGWRSVTVQ